MTEQIYRIRFKIGDAEIEVDGDKNFVDEKFSFLLKELQSKIVPIIKTEKPVSSGPKDEKVDPILNNQKPALKLFITEKNPSTGIKITVVLAYYLTKFEGKETFTDDDIKKLWMVSGCKPPKKLQQMVIDCKSKHGWFDSVSRGVYKINEHGIYLVESELPSKKK